MGTVDERLRRRLLKIAELAARGENGEKLAAESMLAKLLKKHNLSFDDLSEKRERGWVVFTCDGRYELQLLEQIIRRVTKQNEFERCRSQHDAGTSWYALTPQEHAEVGLLFGVLKTHLHEHLEKTLAAFVLKNELYGPIIEGHADVALSPAEQARYEQIAMLAQDMEVSQILPALK